MSGPRIEQYAIRYADTGEVKEDAWGVVWEFENGEMYFDEFPNNEYRTNWVERYNQMHGTSFNSKGEVWDHLSSERKLASTLFTDFKREYARKYLPRIDRRKCVTNIRWKD